MAIGFALLGVLLAGLICARASLGRTASWSFPIDDAYIYANYVRALDAGHPFAYNYGTDPGETSGGVTSAGWMLLLGLAYPLTGLLGAAPTGLAPAAVRAAAPDLAREAGRLYLASYSLGALLFAGAAGATAWLAWECYRDRPSRLAPVLAGLAGAALLADPAAIWGAYSGLEIPLSLLLIALAPATLLYELRTSSTAGSGQQSTRNTQHATRNAQRAPLRLRWSLLAVTLLPWARPELAIVGGVATLWLTGYVIRIRGSFRPVVAYVAALLTGFGAMAAVFWAYTGRPLPSSFYAKVGGLRPDRVSGALQEWILAGAWQPFALLGAAALGTLALWLVHRRRPAPGATAGADPCPALLACGCAAAYFGAMLLALRWFGQEDRYILPIHALALPLAGGIPTALAALPGPVAQLARLRLRPRNAWLVGGILGAVALIVYIGSLRVWAASDYALFVQNIENAHITPALWLAAHAPAGATIAAEPIGAIQLFSGHPTVDIVGLTTPTQLGHYADWPATESMLRARHAQYLLYYPHWWPGGQALPWAQEVQRFAIPDNRMAGDSPIAVYRLFGP